MVGLFKSISVSVLFLKFPELKDRSWGGEFWEDRYFVRTVGDEVTADIIHRYINYHQERERSPKQLQLL